MGFYRYSHWLERIEIREECHYEIYIFIFIAFFTGTVNAQGVTGSTFGLGAKIGFSKDFGALSGAELYYKTGNWQYELYSSSSSVNLHHSFSKEIEQPDVFAGATTQGKIISMLASVEHTGFNLRWFFSGSTNIGIGYTQYNLSVDYEIVSDDETENYKNIVSSDSSALTASFGNQWKFGIFYLGFDWIYSFQPTAVAEEGLTQSK